MAPERFRATLLAAILAAAGLTAHLAAQEPKPPAGVQEAPAAPAPATPAPAEDPAKVQARLATALDGALIDTKNGDDLMVETSGSRRLLQLVNAVEPADATRRATINLDRAAALANPDALRGQWVRVEGLLATLRAERLDRPLDGAVDVWEGAVTDADGSDAIIFDMLQRPEGFEERRDMVVVEGIYYRTARYESRDGHIIEAPYLVARNVLPMDTSERPVVGLSGGPLAAILIGAAVVYFVVRVLMMVRDRGRKPGQITDSTRAIRQAAEKHLREARAAQKSAGRTDPSSPSDPPAKPS